MLEIKRNGITISVDTLPDHKCPVLLLGVDGEICTFTTKVASFDDMADAKLFCDKVKEFFQGIAEVEVKV